MSKKKDARKAESQKLSNERAKKEARLRFRKQFIPLIATVLLWIVTSAILHLPSIKNEVATFFINFTIESSIWFGKIFFIPISSSSFPHLAVGGYHMQVVMECTAYNFYVFVFFLSLLSPVSWKQRLLTLLIFLLAVFVVNNLRFVTVGYIGAYSEELFHLVHDYLWNILFGFLVFLIWAWRYNKTYTEDEESGH